MNASGIIIVLFSKSVIDLIHEHFQGDGHVVNEVLGREERLEGKKKKSRKLIFRYMNRLLIMEKTEKRRRTLSLQ